MYIETKHGVTLLRRLKPDLFYNYVTKCKSTIEKTLKLRMYIMFKDIFEPETYIIKCMSRRRRSLMSQFRTGILPLEIETGRYVPIFDKNLKKNRKRTANERICKLCRINDIENEYHFLCVCPVSYIVLFYLFIILYLNVILVT